MGTLLLIGASRGLGYAIAEEFLKKGWHVVASVRGSEPTPLHDLQKAYQSALEIETLDVTSPQQITELRNRLSGRIFDILFVNAGTANTNQEETIAETSTEEFTRVMITNALSPMRVIEGLESLVANQGTIGIMSSGQGSITNNNNGGKEVYRGSKAALNQYMRSYAARQQKSPRAFLLLAPGWIKTDLGGPDAPFTMEEAIPQVVQVILDQKGRTGLRYLDRNGETIPW